MIFLNCLDLYERKIEILFAILLNTFLHMIFLSLLYAFVYLFLNEISFEIQRLFTDSVTGKYNDLASGPFDP
jgi:hypothetical protein